MGATSPYEQKLCRKRVIIDFSKIFSYNKSLVQGIKDSEFKLSWTEVVELLEIEHGWKPRPMRSTINR